MKDTPVQRASIKKEAQLLSGITGHITPDKEELWESASAIVLGRDWDVGQARVFVCWLSGGSRDGRVNKQG